MQCSKDYILYRSRSRSWECEGNASLGPRPKVILGPFNISELKDIRYASFSCYLDKNKIQEIGKIIEKIDQLTYLNLGYNEINRIDNLSRLNQL